MENLRRTAIALLFVILAVSNASASENASNPLAAVNNLDLRSQYFDLGGSDLVDFWADGAYMATEKLKLKYELHYWNTDVTGTSEYGLESVHFKPIYFPTQGKLGTWMYRVAVGLEWIASFGNEDKGIGSGADQLAPLAGMAFVRDNLVLVPLVQHFTEYSGPDVNLTAFRLIAIQSLANAFWAKLDAKIPVDWENDNAIPATAEVQIGKMFTPKLGAYMDGLVGIGTDRPYDWGLGLGVRMNF